MGIEGLKSAFGAIAKCLNVVGKLLNKQGLWVLLELREPIATLSSMNFGTLKQEAKDLSEVEREALEAYFKGLIDFPNKDVQARFLSGVDCLEESADLVEDAIGIYNKGISLVGKFKALFA